MTDKKTYNKLVRNRIPEIIAADDRQCDTGILNNDAYRQALLAKVVEEAQEVASAGADDISKEIADLYEVLDALLTAFELNKEAILFIQKKRREERGGFEKRIKLLWTE